MRRFKMIVLSRAVPGREVEYHEWYQGVHLGQVVNLPGIKLAQRFALVSSLTPRAPEPFLAIYDIETDDIDGVVAQMQRHAGTQRLVISDALDQASTCAAIYEQFGDPVIKKT